MRFFVPNANDLTQSEHVYQSIRDRIAKVTGGVSPRRIYHLKFHGDGHPETAVVGSDRHAFGSGPVVAIFEGLNGEYYVCTQASASADLNPHHVHTSAIIHAEDFSALA